jgi:hypothetical protein
VVIGVLLLGGMALGAFFLIKETGGSSAASAAVTSGTAGPPDRYTVMPSCAQIGGRIDNLPKMRDMPPGAPPATDEHKVLAQLGCEWDQERVPVALASMSLSTSVKPGSGDGEGYARAGYSNAVSAGAQPITGGLGKATAAAEIDSTHDKSISTMNCKVHFYQGNIDAEIIVFGVDAHDTDIDRCRANARKLAVATSEAIG